MLMLSSVLSDENTPLHVRNAASLALKNALTARVRYHFLFFSSTPYSLDGDHRRAYDKLTISIDGFHSTMRPSRRLSRMLSSLLGPTTKRLVLLPPLSSPQLLL